jgi:tetratricopeptide (TPR) repeat protein
MKNVAVLAALALLAACAATTPPPSPEGLFNDALFVAPSGRIGADEVFEPSEEMKHFLRTEIVRQLRSKGTRQGLVDALYSKDQLKLEYDSLMTRNAAQAFAARAGNCLSLVIMTAALAKELGLPVRYQSGAPVDDSVGRSGDIYFSVGHVNVTLGNRGWDRRGTDSLLTIDFLPQDAANGLRMQVIEEGTIVAMYMNNKAAESLTLDKVDDAYWWARGAMREDPRFLSAYNTLGIVYRHHGNPAEAEKVFRYALEREPENTRIMSNLIPVLHDLGRVAESEALVRKLEQLDPNPPFRYFERGVKAMRVGDYSAARDLFAREVDRAPYYHEFHFWLAAAYLGLGQVQQAGDQLRLAIEYSTTPNDRALYATKLERIRSTHAN